MARMIPKLLSPEIKSNAERKIFAWFRDAPDTDDWIVLHSLGIANHRNLIYGEVDFLVLAPLYGIFALEVKGGRVSRNEGVWQFTDRYGKTSTKTRGPFEQAQDGIFSIASAIRKKYGDDSKLAKVFFSSGVMFPDIEFKLEGIDAHQWMVFDKNDGDDVKRYIHRLSTNVHKQWEEKYNKYYEEKIPDRKDIKELAGFLRGDFDKVVTLASSIKSIEEELIQLTTEQTKCLDQLEDNPRCLIEGGAGTGKTLLAIEAVKKAAATGEQTAFFCFNKLLAAWLKNYFEAIDPNLRPLYIGTFHDFIFEIAEKSGNRINQPENAESDFWKTELPLAALDAAEKLNIKYDRIIIDEAQDLINDNYLEVFDCILRGGIERGKWYIFGDFSSQAIFSSISEKEMKTMLDDRTSFVRFRLKTNCRNTKPIANEIMDITGFDKSSLLIKTEGPPVTYITWKDREDHTEKLENLLERLKKEKIPDDQITILAPVRLERSTAKTLSVPVAGYSASPAGAITFSTIQAFKGLENSVIILIDITSYGNDPLMYVALSRARSSLFVFETERAHNERSKKSEGL
ncbi:MAG: AAA family ATPase [Treponema sp.]|nr:AAA family ATPase [Treponema sp.]